MTLSDGRHQKLKAMMGGIDILTLALPVVMMMMMMLMVTGWKQHGEAGQGITHAGTGAAARV
jgi:hypothetical protein